MKLSEFRFAMEQEFGAFASTLSRDLQLPALGGRTVDEALSAGVAPREAWVALCREQGVPEGRIHGAHLVEPKKR